MVSEKADALAAKCGVEALYMFRKQSVLKRITQNIHRSTDVSLYLQCKPLPASVKC